MKRITQKLFQKSNSGVAALILALASLVSYICGLLRDVLISNYFGASLITDAYNTAFLIPDFIYTITVAGALSGIILPVFKKAHSKDPKDGWELAGAFLTFSQLLVIGLSVVAFIFMPHIIDFAFGSQIANQSGLTALEISHQKYTITMLSRILLLSPVLFTISNGLGTILISFKHYVAYALSASFYNAGIIAGIYLLHESFGIYSAAIGVGFGLVLHLFIRIIDGWHLDHNLKLRLWHPQLPYVFKLALPKTIGLLAWQFCLWAYNIIGYGLAEGSIAAFGYARNIQSFAVSLFGISIATAIFPFLVDYLNDGKTEEYRKKLQNSLIQIALYTIPAATGLALLSTETVTVLLGRGAFTQDAIILTSSVLFFFAFSIVFESLTHVFARAYYSFHNVIIPVTASLVFMSINLIGSFLMAPKWGASAFSIFFVIATAIQIIILVGIFHHKFLKLQLVYLAQKLGLVIIGSGLMGGSVYITTHYLNIGILAKFTISIIVGCVVYGIWIIPTGLINYTGLKTSFNRIRKIVKAN